MQIELIPLDSIQPSPTNPRKHFDPDKLRELADSIKEHGLAQPILLRPRTLWQQVVGFVARQRAVFDAGKSAGYGLSHAQFEDAGIHFENGEYDKAIHLLAKEQRIEPTPGINTYQPLPGAYRSIDDLNQLGAEISCYELVAGERRWRAAQLAGLEEIEATVRDLNDRAALEIQIIENLQRDDLSPIEEADGYSAMLALKNEDGSPAYTVDTLAAKIGKNGKSKSYVYGRLKLRNLPAKAAEALAKGDLPATVGELIGRLPSLEMRERFWQDWFDEYGECDFEMPSFREVKDVIERNYTRELKSAPFSKTDPKLLPEAGACKTCPKMTGNNRDEYPDSRADICTDTGCYDRKLRAHLDRQVKKAKGNGARVLSEEESAKLFNTAGDSAWLRHEAGQKYVQLEDQPYQDKERRSYKQLLDGSVETIVAVDPFGKPYYLAPKDEAARVLKEQHGIKLESDSDSSYKKQQSENRKKVEVRKLVMSQALAHVAKAAEDQNDFQAYEGLMRLLVSALAGQAWHDAVTVVMKRREIPKDERTYNPILKLVPKMSASELLGLFAEMILAREMLHWSTSGYASDMSDRAKEILKFFDFDVKTVERRIKGEQAARKNAKSKPKAKVKAKAKAAAQA